MATDSPLAPSVSLMNTLIEIESSTDDESNTLYRTLVEIKSSIDTVSNVSNNRSGVTLSDVVTDSPLAPSVSLTNTILEIVSSTVAESDML